MERLGFVGLVFALASALTGCASDSSSAADHVPVDIAPDDSHNHVYAAGSSDPASYRQTITDRAYDYGDPNNPSIKKGNTPLETYSQ
jgi:hypothetical protein